MILQLERSFIHYKFYVTTKLVERKDEENILYNVTPAAFHNHSS